VLGVTNERAQELLETLEARGLVALQRKPSGGIVRAGALPRGAHAWYELEHLIGIEFRDRRLLERAFTHASFFGKGRPGDIQEQNQGLEFFGDAVLYFVVREFLFTSYQDSEGTMTARAQVLTANELLENLAVRLGILPFIRHGPSLRTSGRQRYKADVVEALISAIYMDQGLEAARRFVYAHAHFSDPVHHRRERESPAS
jgi:ribonuclease-3